MNDSRPRLLSSLVGHPRHSAAEAAQPTSELIPARLDDSSVVVGFAGTEELSDALGRSLGPSCRVVSTPIEAGQPVRAPSGANVMVVELAVQGELRAGDELAFALKLIRSTPKHVEHVLIVDRRNFQQLIRANPRSSIDFVVRPCTAEELTFRVRRALERAVVQRWAYHLQRALDELKLAAATHLPTRTNGDLAHLVYRDAMQVAHERAAREYLAELMREVQGNVVRAAKRAGLERESLHRLLRRFEIRSGAFKSNRTSGR